MSLENKQKQKRLAKLKEQEDNIACKLIKATVLQRAT